MIDGKPAQLLNFQSNLLLIGWLMKSRIRRIFLSQLQSSISSEEKRSEKNQRCFFFLVFTFAKAEIWWMEVNRENNKTRIKSIYCARVRAYAITTAARLIWNHLFLEMCATASRAHICRFGSNLFAPSRY